MTLRITRLLLAVGVLCMLALPATALAHDGGGHRGRDRGRDGSARLCRAVQNGRTPRNVTAQQAQAIAAACTTHTNAIKAANEAFAAATASARQTFRTTVAPLATRVRTARDAARTACRADRRSQACADAIAGYRTTVRSVAPQVRAARQALRTATAPAARQLRTAVRAAKVAFRTSVNQILGRS